MKKKTTKKITIIFIMNLLTNHIIFKKTGLLLLVILFFLGCKKEKNAIGIDDPSRLPSTVYFTDTLTIKSEVVLISDSINTTNVVGPNNSSLLMAGAYSDPLLGNISAEAYTRLRLVSEFVELPAATADSAFLYLTYSYYYGNIAESQTLNVYALDDYVSAEVTYFSNSASLGHTSLIGSATFNASSDSASIVTIRITDLAYLQSILNASKNNTGFESEIRGLAIVPANAADGAILRIDGNSANTSLNVHYTQYGAPNIYKLSLNSSARKFYRVTADRSGTDLVSLVNNYDSISSAALPSNHCYLQACTGIRTRLSFPYIEKLREAFPNIAVIKGELLITPSLGTENYPPSSSLLLMRTENGKIKRTSSGGIFYVQPDDYSQYANSSINISTLQNNQYTIPLKSYVQAILIKQVPNNPVILSPALLYTDINRLVFDDNSTSVQPVKLNLYFTTTK